MGVQFNYLQQNPDGSVSTQGAIAERPPTWGELADHVASTGATLLPASTEQPPPEASTPREAAPPPAPAAAPPLPTDVAQTTGLEPTNRNPPRALGTYALPAAAAALGAYALPAIGTAIAGPIGFFGGAGLAATGAGLLGGAGEYGQAQLERGIYGEPPPGSPTPFERAQRFADTAGKTEMAVQLATPLVAPIARAVSKPFGSTAVTSAADARGLLTTGVGGGEDAAIASGQGVLGGLAKRLEQGHTAESIRAGAAAPTVVVNTDGLAPLVSSTRAQIAGAGASVDDLALFDRNMTPLMQGGPQPLQSVLSAERNVNRWTTGMASRVPTPEFDALGTSTRNAISTAVDGTPAAQPFQRYLNQQAATMPQRAMLHEAADQAPEALQGFLTSDAGKPALGAIVEHGSPDELAQVGQAWLASTRQAARTALDPAKYVADAYEALSPTARTAMFGEQTPALAKLIGTASGATGAPGLSLPKIGMVQVPIARPWARATLMSPAWATGTSLVRPALTSAGRTALQMGVAQADERRP